MSLARLARNPNLDDGARGRDGRGHDARGLCKDRTRSARAPGARAARLRGRPARPHPAVHDRALRPEGRAATSPTRSRLARAFIDFGYNECVDSFAGFGIFRLARDARILPEALTSLFVRVLVEEARHIVFFVNWVAWDRYRRGLRGPVLQALPALLSYGSAIWRRVKGGAEMQGGGEARQNTLDLFGDVLKDSHAGEFCACLRRGERPLHGGVRPAPAASARHSLAREVRARAPRDDRPNSRRLPAPGAPFYDVGVGRCSRKYFARCTETPNSASRLVSSSSRRMLLSTTSASKRRPSSVRRL